jgi:hypothetical protein
MLLSKTRDEKMNFKLMRKYNPIEYYARIGLGIVCATYLAAHLAVVAESVMARYQRKQLPHPTQINTNIHTLEKILGP